MLKCYLMVTHSIYYMPGTILDIYIGISFPSHSSEIVIVIIYPH